MSTIALDDLKWWNELKIVVGLQGRGRAQMTSWAEPHKILAAKPI